MKRDSKNDPKIDLEINSIQDPIQAVKWSTKRKVKLGRRILIIGIIFLVLAAITSMIYFIFIKKTQVKDTTYTPDITVGSKQELLVGQITSMNGNEIDFDIVEETSFDIGQAGSGERQNRGFARGENQSNENQEQTISQNIATSEGEMPEGVIMPEGEMPQGVTMPEGEMPEGVIMPEGEMPEGVIMPEGEMPQGVIMPEEEASDAIIIYQSTGDSKSLQIPVGTEVVTKLGNITTFSRLAVGDVVNLLVEKTNDGETIVKIWIVG